MSGSRRSSYTRGTRSPSWWSGRSQIGRASWRGRVEFRRVLFRSGLGPERGEELVTRLAHERLAPQLVHAEHELRVVVVRPIPDRKSVVEGKSGVQACALPIWSWARTWRGARDAPGA